MPSIRHLFAPLTKAVHAFFKSDLRVQRADGGLRVVFDDTPPVPRKSRGARPDPQVERDRRDFERMHQALRQLLDELPENRSALRHLAFIEHALAKKGARALQKVPVDVLQHALQQFEGLVVNWSDEGLACLRSKMAVALIEREGEKPAEDGSPPVSVMESAPLLAHPVALEGDDAAEAEAALRAAYGSVSLPGLELSTAPEADDGAAVEIQGELNSPSARALGKATRRAERDSVTLRLSEFQDS